ncbi:alkaline phosphatase family protein [Chloroflexota bacterium]
MKNYTSIGLSILVLAGVIVGMTLWVRAFYTSVQNYRSPLKEIDLSPSPSSPATNAGKVVIVLIGGLGYDTSLILNLPVLEQLKQIGVNVAVESIPPTYSRTAWATLISGASPETNDAPPVDMPLEKLYLLEVDTIFARARQARLQTALLGMADWRRLIPRNQLDYVFFVDEPGPEADRVIFETALSIIEGGQADLMLIHFTQVNFAGQHQGGPSGPAYLQAANRIDAYLGQISAAMNLRDTTLVVLSDHGQISSGGYGGAEPDVIWQQVVMVGGNTNPGNYSDIHQTDIVPTISTLLGIAPPGAAQGRILFEMLRLDEYNQAVAQLLLANQRTALAEAYISQIQGEPVALPDTLSEDLAQAQASLNNNNIGGAFELAQLAQQEADTQMTIARNSRIRREQLPRLVITALIVLVWLVTMWRRRGLHAGSVVIATVATVVLYHALYWLQGYSYSISALAGLSGYTELPFDVARRVAVSLLAGGGLLLIFFMLTDEVDWAILLGTGYGFSMLVTFIFILPFFWGSWQNGLVATWRLPEVDLAFWQISSAFESMSAAVLGLILPWPIMSLSLFINLIRRRLSDTRARKTSSGTLPGLRF